MAAQGAVRGVPYTAQSSVMGYDDLGRRETSIDVLARNLALMKERTGLSYEAVVERGGGSIRTLHRVKAKTGGGNTTLDTLDALARGFGLQSGRDLLNPNLAATLDHGDWLDRAARILSEAGQAAALLKNAIGLAESSLPKKPL